MIRKIHDFGKMIKFSHSIFALPFALSGAILALQIKAFNSSTFLWIVLAMFSARTAAMAFNRLVDAQIDAKNPRTQNREIPSGKVTPFQSTLYTILSSLLFIFAAYKLNLLCFYLSPIALFVILSYSYTKRFTWLCHLILGLALALAPIGSWLALTGEFALLPILLGIAVLFWVAGFDIIYASQDYEFDKKNQLKSIPVFLGLEKSLLIARFFHIFAFLLFFSIYFVTEFHWIYLVGLALIAFFLIQEHRLVNASNMEKIGLAFFNMNGTISIVYLIIIITNHFLV